MLIKERVPVELLEFKKGVGFRSEQIFYVLFEMGFLCAENYVLEGGAHYLSISNIKYTLL